MSSDQREIVLILGQTGSGKTFAARALALGCSRVLIADSGFGDYAPIPTSESYEDMLTTLDALRAFDGVSPFRLALDFEPGLDDLDHDRPFATALSLKHCWLIIEEADRFSFESHYYREAVYRGRHMGLSLCAVSLSPKDLPTDLRRQATKIISYRQIMPADLDWLAEIMGPDAYKLAELPGPPAVPPHPYGLWTPAAGLQFPALQKINA